MVKVSHKRHHHYIHMWLYICLVTNMLLLEKEEKQNVRCQNNKKY